MRVIVLKHWEILVNASWRKDWLTFFMMDSGITFEAKVEASRLNSNCTIYSSTG